MHKVTHLQEQYHYFSNKEMDLLYLHSAIKGFAQAIISVFIPIYLLTLGFSLHDVFIYYITQFTAMAFFWPFFTMLNPKGVKLNMIYGTLLQLSFYLLLTAVPLIHPVPLAILSGISISMYWVGFHSEFVHCHKRKSAAKDFSMVRALTILGTAFGPLFGGFLILLTNYQITFFTAVILLGLSTIPLGLTKDYKQKIKTVDLQKVLKSGKKEEGLAYVAHGFCNMVGAIMWPIFIYLTVKNVFSLGFILSLGSFFLALVTVFIGRTADKNPKKTYGTGVLFYTFSWIIRPIFITPIGLFFTNLYSQVSATPWLMAISKRQYKKAKDPHYLYFRELHLTLGRLAALLIAIIYPNIIMMMLLAAIVTQLFWPARKLFK